MAPEGDAYLADKQGEFAFVTTNSMTQGEPVANLFEVIHGAGWRIKFAHRTFRWDSESASKDKAAVHCVIIGFTRDQTVKQRLFDYPDQKTPAELESRHRHQRVPGRRARRVREAAQQGFLT